MISTSVNPKSQSFLSSSTSTSWEIRQNELPEAVNNTLNNQYGEYRFDEAEYIEKADVRCYHHQCLQCF